MEKPHVKSSEFHRAIFQISPDAICLTKLDGTMVEVNQGFCDLTGYTADEVLGNTSLKLNLWHNIEERERLNKRLIEDNFVKDVVAKFRRKNGSIIDGMAYARLIDIDEETHILSVIRDITEQKKAQEILKEKESRFAAFMDNIPAAIFIKDSENRFTFLNKFYKEVLNADSNWLGKTTLQAVIPEKTAQRMVADDQKALAVGPIAFDEKGIDNDGNLRHFRTIKFPIVQADETLQLGGFAFDITIEKEEERLRNLQHDLALAISGTDDQEQIFKLCMETSLAASRMDCGGIYLLDENSQSWNMVYHLGLSEKFVTEMSHYKNDAPESQIFAPGKTVFLRREDILTFPGDSYVEEGFMFAAIIPIRYQSKIIACFNLAARSEREIDEKTRTFLETITFQIGYAIHRSRTHRALEESELKYRNVVDNANEAICVTQDGGFKYFNPKMLDLMGVPETELLSKAFVEFIHPEDRELVMRRHIRRLKGEHFEEVYSFRIITGENEIRWVDIKPVRILWENNPAILNFLTNITERKRNQELMIQTEKMMSVGGLAAGMAHEINNPLGAILQSAQIISRRFLPDLRANAVVAADLGIDLNSVQKYMNHRKIHKCIEGIRQAGERAAIIISDMLKFSRKSDSELLPIDLHQLLNKSLDLAGQDFDLKKKYDFKKITLEKIFDTNIPQVPCIETEITQVILNVLKNAAQALYDYDNRESPRITLRTARKDGHARIEIQDNGPGFDEKTKRRVFEPFFTTKPPGEGTGLGLSVSYTIISLNHYGTIEVESEVGKGTCFIIQLPFIVQKS